MMWGVVVEKLMMMWGQGEDDTKGRVSLITTNRHLGVSKNRDTPKSSILIGFSIINHPF